MNTCDYIIETLYLNGIDTYFVITGGAIVPFINAIARNPKVKYYCFQHEQSAAMAAEGYYRSSGKTAGVVVTSGPGVQNLLNGVCGCWYDSIPAFFISGQVNTKEDLSNFKSVMAKSGYFNKDDPSRPVVGQELPLLRLMSESDGTIPDDRGDRGLMIFVTPPMRSPGDWFLRTDTSLDAPSPMPKDAFTNGFDTYITCPRGGVYARVHDTLAPTGIDDVTDEDDRRAFWAFTEGTLAEDLVFQIREAIIDSGTDKKVTLVCDSLSCPIVARALAFNNYLKVNTYVKTSILLSPLFVPSASYFTIDLTQGVEFPDTLRP